MPFLAVFVLSFTGYAIVLWQGRAEVSFHCLSVGTLSYRELITIVLAAICLRKAKSIITFKRQFLANWPAAQEEYTLAILKAALPFTNKSKLFLKDLCKVCELKGF